MVILPANKAEEMVTISKKEYDELLEMAQVVDYLCDCSGVDYAEILEGMPED